MPFRPPSDAIMPFFKACQYSFIFPCLSCRINEYQPRQERSSSLRQVVRCAIQPRWGEKSHARRPERLRPVQWDAVRSHLSRGPSGQKLDTVACLGCGLVGHAWRPRSRNWPRITDATTARNTRQERPSKRRVCVRPVEGRADSGRELQPYLAPGAGTSKWRGVGCTVKVFESAGFDASGVEPGTAFQRYSQEVIRASEGRLPVRLP